MKKFEKGEKVFIEAEYVECRGERHEVLEFGSDNSLIRTEAYGKCDKEVFSESEMKAKFGTQLSTESCESNSWKYKIYLTDTQKEEIATQMDKRVKLVTDYNFQYCSIHKNEVVILIPKQKTLEDYMNELGRDKILEILREIV